MVFKQEHLNFILEDKKKYPQNFIVVVGPTCTGKTDLSIAIAESLKLPIINADSRLIFAEMNIGTAKPSPEELNQATHYLVNIKKPNETYSAGDYRKDFDMVVRELNQKAIVVGGTGLYIRTALENLDMPEVNTDENLRAELKNLSLEDLRKKLFILDPNAGVQVDLNNPIRIIRAIEIISISGKPLEDNRNKALENRYSSRFYGLNFHKRQNLYDLIDKRVIRMIDQGLVQEVKELIDRYGISRTLMSTIGYKEIIEHLQGQYSLEEAITQIQKKTRNYAKRQITWFKANPDIQWLYQD